MTLGCTIMGAACLLYYILIALYAGPTADFAWFWIGLGAALLLAAYLMRFEAGAAVWVRRALLALILAGAVLSAAVSIPVIRTMTQQAPADLPCVVVLGAQVRGTSPSRALKRRLEKAAQYARENPETVLILSGGHGDNEDISEAQCMRDYLTEAGIGEERLRMEDRSTTTRENLIFSDELTGCAQEPCGILSNNFHVFRAVTLAKELGYRSPAGIPARSDPVMQLHYVVRETVALVTEKLKGEI